MAKVKVVKAWKCEDFNGYYRVPLNGPCDRCKEVQIVCVPHNYIITARPPTTPKPKARGKKGSK